MEILVYIEAKEGKAVQGSLEMLGGAAALGNVSAVAVEDAEAAAQAAALGTPVTVLKTGDTCEDAIVNALEAYIAEKKPDIVMIAATQFGKDIAPRLAQRAGAGCITDVTAIENGADGLVYTRPAFGGTVLEKLTFTAGGTQYITVKGGSFQKPAAGAAAAVTEATASAGDIKAKVIEAAKDITDAVDLEGADIIVAGGRGMGSAEDFKLIEQLAEVLGAEVGASRPAIEEGWISRVHQIGQSGKTVAPKLYIACGISGAMQHISAAMGAKYIVAINKDPDASIFNYADVGMVGDAKVIIPMLIEEIKNRKG